MTNAQYWVMVFDARYIVKTAQLCSNMIVCTNVRNSCARKCYRRSHSSQTAIGCIVLYFKELYWLSRGEELNISTECCQYLVKLLWLSPEAVSLLNHLWQGEITPQLSTILLTALQQTLQVPCLTSN